MWTLLQSNSRRCILNNYNELNYHYTFFFVAELSACGDFWLKTSNVWAWGEKYNWPDKSRSMRYRKSQFSKLCTIK